MDQPRDYADPIDDVDEVKFMSFEEFAQEELNKMSFLERINFELQQRVYSVAIVTFILSYIAGARFGTAWIFSLWSRLIT